MEKLTLKGTRFVNESGKEVILHGLNVLQRQRENNHFYPEFEKAFGYFRRSGFNLLRFGIFWDGAEPEPGQVDMEYLRKVKNIVNLAEENGIYILLDMHQDLFAQKFIDGAPDWACLDEGLPHPEHCKLWYEAYLQSRRYHPGGGQFLGKQTGFGRRGPAGPPMPLCGRKSRRPWMAAEISSALSP